MSKTTSANHSTCEICGGSLAEENKVGICSRKPKCDKEHRRKYRAMKDGREYKPRKYCARCGRILSGRSNNQYCRVNSDCQALFLSDRYSKRRNSGYVKRSWERAKHRAKIRQESFTLTLDDVPPIPTYCPALGLELSTTNIKVLDNSASLDCIVPGKGYSPGNVQWLSYKANSMKRNASPEELRRFSEWILTN